MHPEVSVTLVYVCAAGTCLLSGLGELDVVAKQRLQQPRGMSRPHGVCPDIQRLQHVAQLGSVCG